MTSNENIVKFIRPFFYSFSVGSISRVFCCRSNMIGSASIKWEEWHFPSKKTRLENTKIPNRLQMTNFAKFRRVNIIDCYQQHATEVFSLRVALSTHDDRFDIDSISHCGSLNRLNTNLSKHVCLRQLKHCFQLSRCSIWFRFLSNNAFFRPTIHAFLIFLLTHSFGLWQKVKQTTFSLCQSGKLHMREIFAFHQRVFVENENALLSAVRNSCVVTYFSPYK